MGDEEGCAVISITIGSGHHRVFQYCGVLRQCGLHLTRLDPEAADLHLVVEAPQVFDVAVGQVSGPVAGAVEQLAGFARIAAKRIGDEAGGRRVGPVEVAASYPDTADEQLTGHAHRHWLAMGVQQVGADVGDRPPDRHQRAGFATLAVEVGDVDRGFGGTVEVV